MSKIYNEIVIDMNPQSPSFEKVIYEDSFEYSGDMILAQGTSGHEGERAMIKTGAKAKYYKDGEEVTLNAYQTGTRHGRSGTGYTTGSEYPIVEYRDGQWVDTKEFQRHDKPEGMKIYSGMGDLPSFVEGGSSDWGAENLTKEMFINADGSPKTVEEIYNELDKLLPGITGEALTNQINDMLPKFQAADQQEKDFLGEAKGLTETGADITYGGAGIAAERAEDVYGLGMSAAGRERETAEMGLGAGLGQLQAGAGQAGAQMRGAYGGMGGGARGAIGAQATMAKGVEQTYGKYGLAMGAAADEEKRLGQERGYAKDTYALAGQARDLTKAGADLTERQGVYRLEKGAAETFEADVLGTIDESSWVTPETGALTTEDYFAQEGGLIPEKSMQEMIDEKRDQLQYARGYSSGTPFVDKLSEITGASSESGSDSSYSSVLSRGLSEFQSSQNGNGGETFMNFLTQLPDAGGS